MGEGVAESHRAQRVGSKSWALGIVRCKRMLMNSDLPFETKCPALILPCRLTVLIKRECHERVMHNIAELCTHIWLIRGRQIVKGVISSCNRCERLEGSITLLHSLLSYLT